MTSKDRNIFIGLLGLMLILRAGDIYITYLITPDLDQEWNPLVSVLGYSWTGLLILQVLLYLIAAFCAYYSVKNDLFMLYKKGLGYREFVYFHFNGRLDPPQQWLNRFFKLPNFDSVSLSKHFAFLCFVYPATFITISLFAILNNWLIYIEVSSYMHFVFKYANAYIIGTFVLSIFLSSQMYFYRGYRRYR